MSSHHSQRTINLHHQQVNGGRERRLQKQEAKRHRYLTMRQEGRLQHGIVLSFGFLWFAYFNIATAVYLGYVI